MVTKLDNGTRQRAAEELIQTAADRKITDQDKLFKLHKMIVEKFSITMLTNDELSKSYHNLVKNGKIEPNRAIEDWVKLKQVRSMSGIVVVSILTKPYNCPGNCLYCPSQEGLPKSYMKKEPAVMRAILNDFDPYRQTQNRLTALQATGHPLDKINIRVIGGTWSYYPKQYQSWFIKRCFQACNDFGAVIKKLQNKNSLNVAQKENETAKCRIVEISIETRQDYINVSEIKQLRKLGVTKVELGAQSIYDDVLILNRRGHTVEKTIDATKLLKEAGFKVAYQIMLNLPGSNFDRDEKMLKELFSNPNFRPDYLKIYPLAIVKEAPVYELYQKGELKPYTQEELTKLISGFKKEAPYYLRIERIIRDIPSDDIVEGGAKISNLRQLIKNQMDQNKIACRCIRCREVGNNFDKTTEVKLTREDYEASDGKEIFLSFESADRKILYSMIRLRIPACCLTGEKHFLEQLDKAALIREIHTYGPQVGISRQDNQSVQHRGYGKKLLAEAERIAKEEFGLKIMAVISGVGVRNYFAKFGYNLEATYMIKTLSV